MERVRRKLAGVDDGNRQMVDILTAVLTDGLPGSRGRLRRGDRPRRPLRRRLLNILARQRDPGRTANILTPAALTLRHLRRRI
jgi:hypothetical protein